MGADAERPIAKHRQSLRNPAKDGRKPEGLRTPRKHNPQNQPNKAHEALIETEAAIMEPA